MRSSGGSPLVEAPTAEGTPPWEEGGVVNLVEQMLRGAATC